VIQEIHAPTSSQHSSGWTSSRGAHHRLAANLALDTYWIRAGKIQEHCKPASLGLYSHTLNTGQWLSVLNITDFAPFNMQFCHIGRRFCSKACEMGYWIRDQWVQTSRKT